MEHDPRTENENVQAKAARKWFYARFEETMKKEGEKDPRQES